MMPYVAESRDSSTLIKCKCKHVPKHVSRRDGNKTMDNYYYTEQNKYSNVLTTSWPDSS